VKNEIAYRIRKLRESKDYSQQNMADELGISTSAYSKIETGKTDPSIGRLYAIAKILDVDVISFFPEPSLIVSKAEETGTSFATKKDIEELHFTINRMKQEIAALKTMLNASNSGI
jgi:XRE family transcriptional regulator, regulator of sulfur utilization